MRKKVKEWLEHEIDRLSKTNPEDFSGDGYIVVCFCVLSQIKMGYELGWITPEQANSYRDIVESLMISVRPEVGDANA